MPNRRYVLLALLLGIIALCIYGVITGRTLRYPSIAPYYLQLAEYLKRGQGYIELSVNTGYDPIHNQGH